MLHRANGRATHRTDGGTARRPKGAPLSQFILSCITWGHSPRQSQSPCYSSEYDFDLEHAIRQRRHFGQTGVHDDVTDSLIQLSERQQGGIVEARTVFQPRILASCAEGEDAILGVSIVPGSGSWNNALGGRTDTSDDENEAQSDDRSQHGFRHPMEHALQEGGLVHTGLQFQFAANLNHAFGMAYRDFARLQ